ncbi:unnamed protein product [Psylliodes chrysocephalus]|uniref:Uncharacterized protein n=1 Tax=Psylliodes chrysocephalus TaxID=3402493 RepID=A0A9P0CZF0_9CUCU|nr:unnamed protein product [Psylliodes chrysocephala]
MQNEFKVTKQEIINVTETTNKDMIAMLSNVPERLNHTTSGRLSNKIVKMVPQNKTDPLPMPNGNVHPPEQHNPRIPSQQTYPQKAHYTPHHDEISEQHLLSTKVSQIPSSVNNSRKSLSELSTGEFVEVKSNRRQKRANKIGTNQSQDDNNQNAFEGAKSADNNRKLWVFISRVKNQVTEDQIKNYISNKAKNDQSEISVKALKTYYQNKNNKCFLVGTDLSLKNVIYEQNFWPAGVAFERFNFKKGQHFLDNNRENKNEEEDFLPSYLSDRPQLQPRLAGGESSKGGDNIEIPPAVGDNPKLDILSDPQPSTASSTSSCLSELNPQAVANDPKLNAVSNLQSSSSSFAVSPSVVLPYPKAGARKSLTSQRKKVKSAILTDTPVKSELEENSNPKVKQDKRRVFEETSSEEDDSDICYEESGDSETENIPQEYQILSSPNEGNLKKGKFVIASFKGGKRPSNLYRYVCVIDEVNEEKSEYRVVSMKAMDNTLTNFTFVETDISYVNFEDIMGITPDPLIVMKGERMYYKFPMALDIFEHA